MFQDGSVPALVLLIAYILCGCWRVYSICGTIVVITIFGGIIGLSYWALWELDSPEMQNYYDNPIMTIYLFGVYTMATMSVASIGAINWLNATQLKTFKEINALSDPRKGFIFNYDVKFML